MDWSAHDITCVFDMPAFLAYPAAGGPYPAIILMHELLRPGAAYLGPGDGAGRRVGSQATVGKLLLRLVRTRGQRTAACALRHDRSRSCRPDQGGDRDAGQHIASPICAGWRSPAIARPGGIRWCSPPQILISALVLWSAPA